MNEVSPHNAPEKLTVELGDRRYPIYIGEGLLSQAGNLIAPYAPSKKVAIITDENVWALHGKTLEAALSSYETHVCVRPAGEAQKSFEGLEQVLESLFKGGFDRSDLLIAFGGGVIGDLAGFAASMFKRGMPFVQIPTTLLAQVDSSVGGKTAINNRFGKNLVGAFYQPKAVIADTDVLKTLPQREIKAGYAEVLKYGLLGDRAFFDWLDDEGGEKLLALDNAALLKAIKQSCTTKARIVAADEHEKGQRALLNLGHSFAHALELDAGYDGDLLHGEAVSVGMEMAFQYSVQKGLCDNDAAIRVGRHLEKLSMPSIASEQTRLVDPKRLTHYMGQDKKNESGLITLILVKSIGGAFVQKGVADKDVENFLTSLTASSDP
ncbi:3-dehydroquinate synthase [Litorimonas taeanensis]|uniref:3-dehydroquinate synthase n=1 Tax=Litorimonas taeanensis TaxID=568099 RepID=A0A420WEZ8_9PROT|nr:3-dehydroquinate synthase [Litorimonas taeanensis]RKQ69564.1 3-dehydroquinate synthase [Litorimonas taeanensis]